ncbi:LysR family transcriptional regulator [Actimicrobium antarcticum]|uniref:LysR family transcriptional regulator n=1 Tax=Actimicrobium antarcticum TaxID=1051899 RepID=A0ABP7SZ37_9BURK
MAQTEQFTGVAIFVAAARAGSFTAAAERLGITKSAVGKSIARLEQRLSIKLFHRTTRKIALTVDGAAYFASCATALDGIADAELALQNGHQTPSGRLRIDMPAAFGRGVILPILAELTQAYPALTLTLTFTDNLIDPIEEGIDLLIRFGAIKDSSGLVAKLLSSQRQLICASPHYLARKGGAPQSIADLDRYDCIVGYRRNTPMTWSAMDDHGQPMRFAPPSTYEVGDGDAVLAMALAGCGICQLPSFLVREPLRSGALVSVLDAVSTCQTEIYAVWPQTRHLLPKLRCVIDVLEMKGRDGLLS